MLLKLVGITLVIFYSVNFVNFVNGNRASFNESCAAGVTRCNPRERLSCINGTCLCPKPDEMRYDKVKSKCVVLSGDRCSFLAIEKVVEERQYAEKFDCVDNAGCSSHGFCECNPDYFPDNTGSCIPALSPGNNCSNDNECKGDFVCDLKSKTCICKGETAFSPEHNECVVLPGNRCEPNQKCIENADCSEIGRTNNFTCKCRPGYKNFNRTCSSDHGSDCNGTKKCGGNLQCVNGQCQCPFPSLQSYDQSKRHCYVYIRGPCQESKKMGGYQTTCPDNASCQDFSGMWRCECNTGYVEEGKGCKKKDTLGSRCSQTNNSDCGNFAGMFCKNGTCACKDLHEYNDKLGMCQGLVGAMCEVDVAKACMDGATCEKFYRSKEPQGVCECKPPSLPNAHRTCDRKSEYEFIDDEDNKRR